MTGWTALVVFAGSAVGGLARFVVSRRFDSPDHSHLPLGTLAVNLLGCALIGLLNGRAGAADLSPLWQSFLGTGLLGGFTTVSAFSLQAVGMIERGRFVRMLAYAFVSLAGGLGFYLVAVDWAGGT